MARASEATLAQGLGIGLTLHGWLVGEMDYPGNGGGEASRAQLYPRDSRDNTPDDDDLKPATKKRRVTKACDQGHLLLVDPNVLAHTEAFFASSTHNSPSDGSTFSPSSRTEPDEQLSAFAKSPLPSLLEQLAPAPTAADRKKKAEPGGVEKMDSKPATPPVASSSTVPGSPHSWGSPPAFASGLNEEQRKVLGLPTGMGAVQQSQTSMGLHSLASAASSLASASVATGSLPNLPDELVRNQLVDLYFNQIVHPSFPMLDKSRFQRWSAHPTLASSRNSIHSLPSELYLAVFASVTPYLPPQTSNDPPVQTVESFAAPARKLVWDRLETGTATLETVQSIALLTLVDWGEGDLERSWVFSCHSIALSIQLSLHITDRDKPDPLSTRLKTFHSVLIIHTLLCLRLQRAPLIVLEDYDVPLPPGDGEENFELWRSDKSADDLRSEYEAAFSSGSMGDHSGGPAGRARPRAGSRAVRSSTLLTFNRTASLCALGISVLRFCVAPRRGNGRGLANGEQERLELVASLEGWERQLEGELRFSEVDLRGTERIAERSRVVVEMHMLAMTLYLKLGPHISYQVLAFDPVPQALAMLTRLLQSYSALFTSYRSLPILELFLRTLSTTLFTQPGYQSSMHDAPRKAYEELGRIWPVAKTSLQALEGRIEELSGKAMVSPAPPAYPAPRSRNHAMSAFSQQPLPILSNTVSNTVSSDPTQLYLPSATPSSSADEPMLWPQYDQSDLLVSLGLVADRNTMSQWGPTIPMSGYAAPQNHPVQSSPSDGSVTMGNAGPSPPGMSGPSTSGSGYLPAGALWNTAGLDLGGPGEMMPPSLQGASTPSGSMMGGGYGGMEGQGVSTDLLTRWLDRGTLTFSS